MRTIFGMYLEHGSLLPVVGELNCRGSTLKRWTTREGKDVGGKPFTRPRFHRLLTNVIYTGQVPASRRHLYNLGNKHGGLVLSGTGVHAEGGGSTAATSA